MFDKNEYLKKEIMEQSRHLFIYGYDNEYRKKLITSIRESYPIVQNQNSPMAVYLETIGLPITDFDYSLERDRLDIVSRDFLHLNIAASILSNLDKLDFDLLNDNLKRFYNIINKYSVNKKIDKIKDIDKLKCYIEQTKGYYLEKYMSGSFEDVSISEIALPFFQLDLFISEYKKALNNDSYFGIVVEKKDDINIFSTRAINNLVGSRINKDISIKVVTDPIRWDSYRDSNGGFVQSIHDYGTIELDDSMKNDINSLIKKY